MIYIKILFAFFCYNCDFLLRKTRGFHNICIRDTNTLIGGIRSCHHICLFLMTQIKVQHETNDVCRRRKWRDDFFTRNSPQSVEMTNMIPSPHLSSLKDIAHCFLPKKSHDNCTLFHFLPRRMMTGCCCLLHLQ